MRVKIVDFVDNAVVVLALRMCELAEGSRVATPPGMVTNTA